MKSKTILISGAFFSFLSVLIGAFGAHGLKLPEYSQKIFETGVRYQFYHSISLLVIGTLALQNPKWIHKYTPILFIFGIIVFSGSLYLLAITDTKMFGAFAPIGGMSFLFGWVLFIFRICKN